MDNAITTNMLVEVKPKKGNNALFVWLGLGLVFWVFIYYFLKRAADFISFNVLGLSPSSHLGGSVSFFLYDAPKVLMLLVLVVFGIGIIRSFFTPERTRGLLAGKKETIGNIMPHRWVSLLRSVLVRPAPCSLVLWRRAFRLA